ncbi:MAG: helix-turn-helix transcriptional regulator [Gemmiger formicilis]|uniref:helix-turn-helix domain-containing protein n=1 Tax=Gemmiger formicilis TaxID=745368 RepID=UPI003FED7A44|nr:helix-turn-helix transcriptional regulator [Gemmiger formicilis]
MNRIRALREDLDLRQIDVSHATGIDQKTLSNYETGKTQPDMYALIRLADFFNVSLDYLVGRSDISVQSSKDLAREIEHIQNELDKIKCMLLR